MFLPELLESFAGSARQRVPDPKILAALEHLDDAITRDQASRSEASSIALRRARNLLSEVLADRGEDEDHGGFPRRATAAEKHEDFQRAIGVLPPTVRFGRRDYILPLNVAPSDQFPTLPENGGAA